MIGKVPKAGQGFRGLINYLLHGDRQEQQDSMPAGSSQKDASRVAWVEMRNLLISDPDLAPKLMRATALKSRRVKSPVYHYVISWHPDEAPSDDLMRIVADTTCGDLGLADHQLLYVAHRDTDHHHVHIVVNRVHPETGTAWNRRQDWVRIEQSLRRQSEAMGMPIVPGRHTDAEPFQTTPKRPGDGAFRKAMREGAPPPEPKWTTLQISQRRSELAPIFHNSSNWGQLTRALGVLGYSLVRKGQGLVISDGVGVMKLSDVGKHVRLGLLETRFRQPFKDFVAETESISFEGRTLTAPLQQPKRTTDAHPKPHATRKAKEEDETPSIPPPADRSDPKVQRRIEKTETLAGAQDALDFTVALQNFGLTNADDVSEAIAERDAAAEELDKEKSVLEQLLSDLKLPTLKTPPPEPDPEPTQPRQGKRPKQRM